MRRGSSDFENDIFKCFTVATKKQHKGATALLPRSKAVHVSSTTRDASLGKYWRCGSCIHHRFTCDIPFYSYLAFCSPSHHPGANSPTS
ncbi:unnamed protein product [Urochloa humidicola]